MKLRVVEDAHELAVAAAAEVADVVADQPDALLLAATGHSPMGCYAELARLRRNGALDVSRVRVAQLDEYLGLGESDPRSLYGWMDRALLRPLAIGQERVIRLLDGDVEAGRAARAYDAALRAAGGIDLAILGLGANGHLGFNEPPSDADAATRVVSLDPATLESNAGYWQGPVPARALTAGMSAILAARRVLLLVSGRAKASILDGMLRAGPDPGLPASLLHDHPDAIVLADRAARPTPSA